MLHFGKMLKFAILISSYFPFQLEELPLSFNKLTSLKSLDLFNNKLTEIPEALNYFTQLVRLDLSEVNHLFEIGNNYFIMNS